MHPSDVAEYVAEQVADLRRALDPYPELAIVGVRLVNDVLLYIDFHKRDRQYVPASIATGVVAPGGQGVIQRAVQVPLLGVPVTTRPLTLHMDCGDFDAQAPTANLLRSDGSQLPADEWPPLGGGIIHGHRDYMHRPVFCRSGLREYHSHPQHQDDPWDRHRESTSLTSIALPLLHEMHTRWEGKL